MRKSFTFLALAGIVCAFGASAGSQTTAIPQGMDGRISGDYVEARTASVFAGPCHYNGELTTTGRDAEMVWHVRSGAANGVDVSGLNAIAAVASTDNLKNENAPRRAVLFIDARATDPQMKALAGLLVKSYLGSLGEIVAIKRAPITFNRTGDVFHIASKGVTTMTVEGMPNRECCKQPNLVWYRPLADITDRRVGYTRQSGITDPTLGVPWEKSGQNTAFYGTFALGK